MLTCSTVQGCPCASRGGLLPEGFLIVERMLRSAAGAVLGLFLRTRGAAARACMYYTLVMSSVSLRARTARSAPWMHHAQCTASAGQWGGGVGTGSRGGELSVWGVRYCSSNTIHHLSPSFPRNGVLPPHSLVRAHSMHAGQHPTGSRPQQQQHLLHPLASSHRRRVASPVNTPPTPPVCAEPVVLDITERPHIQTAGAPRRTRPEMAEPLVLNSVIGFGGTVENGLLVHPDGRTLIYPLGSTVVLRDRNDARSQEFLQGHSDKVRTEAGPLPCTAIYMPRHGTRPQHADGIRAPPIPPCMRACRCRAWRFRALAGTWPPAR